jgi:inorganic pyrophosphatase
MNVDWDHCLVDVMVETPAGSRNKYEVDHETGIIRLDRRMFSATVYPAEYGFVPETLAGDGDPLDALVLVDDHTFPGCMIRSRIVGVLDMEDEKGLDGKLITVPLSEPRWAGATDITDVPSNLLDEIEHFFEIYKDLEPGKMTRTNGFANRDTAMAELRDAVDRFAAHARDSGHS